MQSADPVGWSSAILLHSMAPREYLHRSRTTSATTKQALRSRLTRSRQRAALSRVVRFLPGTVTISADELVKGASASASTIGASTRDQAKQFLEQALADGPVLQSRIREQANAEGHAWRTIERAKKELKVVSRNRTDLGGWQWSLKPDGQPEMNFGLSEPDDRQVRQQSQFNLLEEVGGEVVEPEDRHKGGSAGSGGLATLADRVSTATTPLQSRIVGTDDGIQT